MLGTTSCCPYLWWSSRAGVAIVRKRIALHSPWTSPTPVPRPLSDDQKTLLEEFRNKVESRISSHGLTAADVQSFVDEIKKHPEVSAALLEEIRSEVGKLMQGQRFSFDFD